VNLHDPPRPSAGLAHEALLYAGGELDATAARAFERRLAEEPLVQDALVEAVQLSQLLTGGPLRPDPAYRDRVRNTVLSTSGSSERSAGGYFRRAVGLSIACGLLLAAALALPSDTAQRRSTAPLVVRQAIPSPSVAHATRTEHDENHPLAAAIEDDPEMLETALEWAELADCGEHLQRTWDEELRRKARHRWPVNHEPVAGEGTGPAFRGVE
jgi:hypothetical protein